MNLGQFLADVPRLERIASSVGSSPERRIVWVRTGGKDAIVEIDVHGRIVHVFVEGGSSRAVGKLWGTFKEGTLRSIVALPRVPPLRGLGAMFPEEEDRTRIALGLLALETEKEGLSARQLYEARGVDRARLTDWLRRGWIAIVSAQGGARYVLTDCGFEVWEALEER